MFFKYLFFLFLALSCQYNKRVDNPTVSLNLKKSTKIELKEFGPQSSDFKESSLEGSGQILKLKLISSLYGANNFMSLFERFESKKVQPDIIIANDIGLLISYLYAKYKNTSKLRWKMFSLEKKILNLVPFSNEWSATIEKFVKKEFHSLRVLDLDILVHNCQGQDQNILIKDAIMMELKKISLSFHCKHEFVNRVDVHKVLSRPKVLSFNKLNEDYLKKMTTVFKIRKDQYFVYEFNDKIDAVNNSVKAQKQIFAQSEDIVKRILNRAN
ncbi:MAG: hypothetical protein N4A33_08545 [Bacteriovoracaceae bacterium]|jgi:hypothetical protein|nr:hypothetical protein [Bacteriovoracaceae bacterium]